MIYAIRETLVPCTRDELRPGEAYVARLTAAEWKAQQDSFDMGIEIDPGSETILSTKADVNYDSLTGSFSIPDRADLTGPDHCFAFALDEKGVVFIDDSGTVDGYLKQIVASKKWRLPSLERFLYDFLEQIVHDDLPLMEAYERELDTLEQALTGGDALAALERVNDIRDDIRDLRIHYEQLMDLGQELEEDENHFFKPENLRYFRLFLNRVDRLRDVSQSLREYTVQIRDLYETRLDIHQNRIMTILTVVTSIFMPLTLITGWYGMNFHFMPELGWKWAYPAVFGLSVLIVIASLIFFKKKKWL